MFSNWFVRERWLICLFYIYADFVSPVVGPPHVGFWYVLTYDYCVFYEFLDCIASSFRGIEKITMGFALIGRCFYFVQDARCHEQRVEKKPPLIIYMCFH